MPFPASLGKPFLPLLQLSLRYIIDHLAITLRSNLLHSSIASTFRVSIFAYQTKNTLDNFVDSTKENQSLQCLKSTNPATQGRTNRNLVNYQLLLRPSQMCLNSNQQLGPHLSVAGRKKNRPSANSMRLEW